MSACPRCQGQKFDLTFKLRPIVADPIKVATQKDGKTTGERTVERTGDPPNEACWWCSSAAPTAACPECGFKLCQRCHANISNPPAGPAAGTPQDQTGGQTA